MNQIIKSKKFPSNHVIILVRDYNGKVIDIISQPHDGTSENIIKQMANLQSQTHWMDNVSGINSQNFATDENGQLKWVIAPNCLSMAEIGTKEARYILGDVSARS
ncbi:hypothetical protein ES703_109055 [subsurface metagenome]